MKRPGLMFQRPGHMPGYHILGVCVVFVGTSRQNKKVASKLVCRLRPPTHVQFYLQLKLRRPNCAKFAQFGLREVLPHTRS